MDEERDLTAQLGAAAETPNSGAPLSFTMGIRVRATAKTFLVAIAAFAGILAWGYWYAATHASLNLRVEDYGQQTDRRLYGAPHGVTLAFFGAGNDLLASAHSVEPAGYIVAIHPDPGIGDCSKYRSSQKKYTECYAVYSAWASGWASRVREAAVTIGGCTLRNVPVDVYSSNADWWLWWVPLPHIGGTPRRYFELVIRVNTKSCTAVVSKAEEDPYTRILGLWEYRQANSASAAGFDDEGERVQFTRKNGRRQGLYFGLEREGEHGLFYTLAELQDINVTGERVSFTVPARSLYVKRPTRLGESLESVGGTSYELKYEGKIVENALTLSCSGPFSSCPDRTLVFRKGEWKK